LGTPRRLTIVGLLAVATLAHGQESTYGRATILPTTELAGGLTDLTPPEFLHPPVPNVDDSGPPKGGWYAAAEFLHMTPRERGLDFAIVDPRNDLMPEGTVQSLNYKPSPGVRASLGYSLPGRGWDIGFTYTYFTATDEFGTAAPAEGLLYPTLTRAGLTNEAQIAAAHSRLTLNVYDITAGRTWDVDDACRMRFFGGVRVATIRQDFSAAYFGRDADNAGVSVGSQYDGVGPLFGTEGSLGFGNGLGLFGRATGGILTGTMRNPFTETNNGGATVYADLRDRFALTVPVISLGVGIGYEYRGLFLRAGYEVTNYFGLFERPTFVDDFAEGKYVKRSSNLALDGFFVQVGLSF
jgi:Legionella pneumophila major outer membrane protein precursor